MDDGRNRFWCNICSVSLNSKSQADQHYVGRVHLNKLKERGMDSSDQNNASNNSSAGLSWCSVCSVSLEPQTSSEHFESRTHLNRCLQKGVGISLVPGSTGIKEGERSSTWCSICNHALESVAQAEEHYESRAHLNKCLQRGVGIPLTYAASAPCVPLPTGPRFSQAGGATSPGASPFPPPPGAGGFQPGITGGQQHKPRPRMPQFTPNSRPAFGGHAGQSKKFPNQPFVRGQAQSNARMSGQYSGGGGGGAGGGGYGGHQEMRSGDSFNQYESSWQQNQSIMKSKWPYCETCDQSFPTVGTLSQHCNSTSHMEMKMMKQGQYHSGPSQGVADQSRFYQGTTGHGGRAGQSQNQGQYYGNQGAGQQDHYRGTNTQNQGGHYPAKEWRPFNRNSQFLS